MEKQNDSARWTDGKTTPKETRDKLLSGQASPMHYQYKIKQAFDPNDLGDAYYRTLE
jgi:hypothetical protein